MSARSSFLIADRIVGDSVTPLIIAEMSGNHNQSLDRALAIVDAVAETGAHALKIQTYTADTMTIDVREGEFLINDAESLWAGKALYDLYEEAHTPWEWHEPIFERAKKKGLLVFSTPFDDTSVDFLEQLEAPCYKIASFENTDVPLIKKVASTGKPVILSTGMASISELETAVRTLRGGGCENFVLLKCTSSYPATPESSNVRTIQHMRELFDCQIGLSDHTMGVGVAIASIAMGATVIEKHFTLRRADGGVDSAFSLEPDEFRNLVVESERAWQGLGRISYGRLDAEEKSKVFRRSLYVVKDIVAGDMLTRDNMRAIRPGYGISPKYYENVIGRRAKNDIKRGTPVSWDFLI